MFVFFRKISFFRRLDSFQENTSYLHDVYCVLKRNIPLFFVYHGNIPSGRCPFSSKIDLLDLKLQSYLNSLALSNRN